MKKNIILYILIIIVLITGCAEKLKHGNEISIKQKQFLRNLGLICDNENIILFSASGDIMKSGNFFTNKRVASYWLGRREPALHYSIYSDIVNIELVLSQHWSLAHKINIIRKDQTQKLRFPSFSRCRDDSIRGFSKSPVRLCEKTFIHHPDRSVRRL